VERYIAIQIRTGTTTHRDADHVSSIVNAGLREIHDYLAEAGIHLEYKNVQSTRRSFKEVTHLA
jgi:small-conductance mechanosensitive channel